VWNISATIRDVCPNVIGNQQRAEWHGQCFGDGRTFEEENLMMKSKTNAVVKPLAVLLALLLATSSEAPPVLAADKALAEAGTSRQYQAFKDPAIASIAVNAGRALVDHLMTAEASLDVGQVGQARSALIVSQDFADAIERIMPYLRGIEEKLDASDHMVAAQLEMLKADLLKIDASIDEMAVLTPDTENQTAAAGVAEHTVYLPVEYVGQQVTAARSAIDRPTPDVSSAKAAIGRALNSLTLVVDAVVETTAS
jgi:hypothetical protein